MAETSLDEFLKAYSNPAFGALPKAQIDAFVVRILRERKEIENIDIWNLVEKLKISSSRARSIIYNISLQTMKDGSSIDEDVKKILIENPIYEEDGGCFLLDVENPLIMDRIKSVLRERNSISNNSFSPSIIRLSLKAFVELMKHYTDDWKDFERRLKRELKDINFGSEGILFTIVKAIANNRAGDSGEKLVDYIKSFWDDRKEFISKCKNLFQNHNNNHRGSL
jgi:hypothetical protein